MENSKLMSNQNMDEMLKSPLVGVLSPLYIEDNWDNETFSKEFILALTSPKNNNFETQLEIPVLFENVVIVITETPILNSEIPSEIKRGTRFFVQKIEYISNGVYKLTKLLNMVNQTMRRVVSGLHIKYFSIIGGDVMYDLTGTISRYTSVDDRKYFLDFREVALTIE